MKKFLSWFLIITLIFQVPVKSFAGEFEDGFNTVVGAPFKVLDMGFKALNTGKEKVIDTILPGTDASKQKVQSSQ